MSYLANFIEIQNHYAHFWKEKQLDVNNLTDADLCSLSEKLESALMPENLSCDGECSRAVVARKYKELNGALTELIKVSAKRGILIHR